MNYRTRTFGSASIAIAAMLALGSTPLVAQTAPAAAGPGPAATAPPPATSEAPIAEPIEGSTQVSTPEVVAEPLLIEPVPVAEQPVANEVTASDAASIPATAAPSESAADAARPEAAAASAPQPAAGSAATESMADAAPTDGQLASEEPAPLAIDPVAVALPVEPETATQSEGLPEEPIMLGLLAALGLGAIGWTAVSQRRRNRRAGKVRSMLAEKVVPVSATASTPAARSAAAPTPSDIREWMRPKPVERDSVPMSNDGAAVALPARPPETFAERDALLRRMVEAPPDRANPFRSIKARIKRARLIIQSLGHTFENGRSRIDFSQYPDNWPELQRNYAAAA